MNEPYVLYRVDLAGNAEEIDRRAVFADICEQAVLAKRARPSYVFYIVNKDQVDVGYDGLTDEEREVLP